MEAVDLEKRDMIDIVHSYYDGLTKQCNLFDSYVNVEFLTHRMSRRDRQELNYREISLLIFMMCRSSRNLKLSFDYNKNDRGYVHGVRWLNFTSTFNNVSKQGIVERYYVFNSSINVVVKTSKSIKFDNITVRDFCVGIALNTLASKCPYFVKTLGCFEGNHGQFHLITEFVEGDTLKSLLQNKRTTFTTFVNIFFQILLGLELAQDKLRFSHYDLHAENVIVVKSRSSHQVALYGSVYTLSFPIVPVMIDFGLSTVHFKGRTIGQRNLSDKGIYDHLSSGYDIYVFLLFCMDVVENVNQSIFKGIHELLKFFRDESKISMEVLTRNYVKSLNNGVSDVIPKKFIDYVVANHSKVLKVKIHPQTRSVNFLEDEPTLVRLCRLFDVEIRDVIAPPDIGFSGLIKSLVHDIKIMYWVGDRDYEPFSVVYRKQLIQTDKARLNRLTRLLNTVPADGVIIEHQKKLFFKGMVYRNLIIEFGLHNDHKFYNDWLIDFENTFVHRNIFDQLTDILMVNRVKRAKRPPEKAEEPGIIKNDVL